MTFVLTFVITIRADEKIEFVWAFHKNCVKHSYIAHQHEHKLEIVYDVCLCEQVGTNVNSICYFIPCSSVIRVFIALEKVSILCLFYHNLFYGQLCHSALCTFFAEWLISVYAITYNILPAMV